MEMNYLKYFHEFILCFMLSKDNTRAIPSTDFMPVVSA